ncbi:MAG: hypothetical protein JSR83_04230 [Proteobacteria bacterium]|nr:hypothetical protein [Pseudomonadota bacterium]MBS0372925.1 hypothetical protein [Pseudomonadota bacterium]RTL24115.1 MAG: hypothetical protein EKK49_21940 [Rhodocyclaceae bacterium]
MTPTDSFLLRHLGWILLAKAIALGALWWFFVHDAKVPVDPAAMSAHLAGPMAGQGGSHGH